MFDVDPYPQIATMREVRPFWEPKWWDLCMAQLMLRDTHWFTVWPHSDMRHLGGVAKTWHFSFWLFGIWFGSWIENGLPPCLKLNTAHLKRLAVQIFFATLTFFGEHFFAVISFEKNSQFFFQEPSSGWFPSDVGNGSFLRNGSTLALFHLIPAQVASWLLHLSALLQRSLVFGSWERLGVLGRKIRQEKTEKEGYDRVKRWFVGMFLGVFSLLLRDDSFHVRSFFWLSRRQHRFWAHGCHISLFLPLYIGHLETAYIFWKPIRLIPFYTIMHRVWYMHISHLYIYTIPNLYLPWNTFHKTTKKSWEKGQSSTEKCLGDGGDMWSFPRRVSPLPPLITEAGPPPTRKPYKENLEDFKAMQAPKGWKIHSPHPGWTRG